MLATLTISGSGAASTQTACGRRARTIRSATIALLAAVLVAAQQLLAEVVVDGGVGAAPGRAGEGDGRDAGARAAHQQLRAGADEGRLRRAAAEAEAGGELLAHRAEERGRVVGGGGADRRPRGRARPCSISPAPIRSVAARDRRFEVARRAGAADLAPARSGAGRAAAAASSRSAGQPRRRARRRAPRRRRPGATTALTVRKRLARRCGRARARAGPASAGGSEDQVERAAALGVEGEAADPDRARRRRAGPAARRAIASPPIRRHSRGDVGEAAARRARPPRGRPRAPPGRTRGRAAPSRTSGRRPAARRRRPRRDRRPRPRR